MNQFPEIIIPDLNITDWREYATIHGNNINSIYSYSYIMGYNNGYANCNAHNNAPHHNEPMMPLLSLDDLMANSPTSVTHSIDGGNVKRINIQRKKKKVKRKTRRSNK